MLLCGPLAENDWEALLPGTPIRITTVGADQEGMVYLATEFGDLQPCVEEACFFISQPAVQEQIDRVAQLLLERELLTGEDEVRKAASFTKPLRSAAWR